MNAGTDEFTVVGTCSVAGGGAGLSSPPPQAVSTAAAHSKETRILFMRCSSLRTGQRRADVREGRQQRSSGLDLGPRLIDTVVQAEHRRAERHGRGLAGRAELVGVG